MPFVATHACFHLKPQPNPALCHGKYKASGWFLGHRWLNSTDKSLRGHISSLLETLDVFIIHQCQTHSGKPCLVAQVPVHKLIIIDIPCWAMFHYDQRNFVWVMSYIVQLKLWAISKVCLNLPLCRSLPDLLQFYSFNCRGKPKFNQRPNPMNNNHARNEWTCSPSWIFFVLWWTCKHLNKFFLKSVFLLIHF